MSDWVVSRPKRPDLGVDCGPAIIAIRCRGVHRADEQHREEEQAAAQEDGGEQPVLHVTDLVAHHADEPEERDPRERHEVQAQPDLLTSARVARSDLGIGVAGERQRIIAIATSSSTAKTIPATAADRRVRHAGAVRPGVVTAVNGSGTGDT